MAANERWASSLAMLWLRGDSHHKICKDKIRHDRVRSCPSCLSCLSCPSCFEELDFDWDFGIGFNLSGSKTAENDQRVGLQDGMIRIYIYDLFSIVFNPYDQV